MRTFLGCWVPLDAQVLCQTLRQRPCHGQTVVILQKQETAKVRGYLPADAAGQCCFTPRINLIDSYSAAERAHASKVCQTASPELEVDISIRSKEDVSE